MPTAFSPTKCAETITDDLLVLAERTDLKLDDRRYLMAQRVRQLVRANFETCARIAEDWAAANRPECLDCEQDGDQIAADIRACIATAIRDFVDERKPGSRTM